MTFFRSPRRTAPASRHLTDSQRRRLAWLLWQFRAFALMVAFLAAFVALEGL